MDIGAYKYIIPSLSGKAVSIDTMTGALTTQAILHGAGSSIDTMTGSLLTRTPPFIYGSASSFDTMAGRLVCGPVLKGSASSIDIMAGGLVCGSLLRGTAYSFDTMTGNLVILYPAIPLPNLIRNIGNLLIDWANSITTFGLSSDAYSVTTRGLVTYLPSSIWTIPIPAEGSRISYAGANFIPQKKVRMESAFYTARERMASKAPVNSSAWNRLVKAGTRFKKKGS